MRLVKTRMSFGLRMRKGLLAWTDSPRSGSNDGLWALGVGANGL